MVHHVSAAKQARMHKEETQRCRASDLIGGEGFLRILEFPPDGKTVRVKTYSPLYDKYLQDRSQQFSFQLDR
jgi:hypothetical protein